MQFIKIMSLGNFTWPINWVDILILILLFRISYVGFNRGLSSELIPFIGTFAALIIALHFYIRAGGFIAAHTPLPNAYSSLITFIGLIILIKYIFHLAETFIAGKILTLHIVSLYDSIGGLIIGAMRGILLVSVVLFALELLPVNYVEYSLKKKSFMAKRFLNIARTVYRRTTSFLRIEQ